MERTTSRNRRKKEELFFEVITGRLYKFPLGPLCPIGHEDLVGDARDGDGIEGHRWVGTQGTLVIIADWRVG